MTREEAWNRIDAIIAKYEIDDEYVTITDPKDYDALRLARKILEQESCRDAISRADVRHLIAEVKRKSLYSISSKAFEELYNGIDDLPSVNPEESKTEIEELDFVQEHEKIPVTLHITEAQKYCDRNICISNEYNGIGCDECEVTKSQESKTDYIAHGIDGNFYKLTISNGKEFEAESEDLVVDEGILALLEKTYADFCNSEGSEGWMKIDGKKYSTDVGYALEGMEIFMEVFKQRLAESEE